MKLQIVILISSLGNNRLNFYRTAAETSFCLVNYEKLSQFLIILAKNVKYDLDLVPSYLLEVKALNHQLKYADAFRLSLRVLGDMGEKLPLDLNDELISMEINENIFQSAHKILNINALNVVEDEAIIAIFQVLYELFITTFFYNPRLLPIIGGRIVKLTCDHGLSKYSAIGLAMAGRMFCSKNDFENGYLYGQLSLSVINKFKAKDLFPKVVAYVHTDIFYYKESIHNMLKLPLKAMATSFEVGDNESLSYNFTIFYVLSFHSGKQLRDLIDDFESICHRVPRKSNSLMSTHQSVLNLVGYAENNNAWLLNGNHFHCVRDVDFENQPVHAIMGLLQCIIMAYIFNEYDKAKEWLELCIPKIDYLAHSLQQIIFIFYEGLLYADLFKKSRDKHYLQRVQSSIDLLKTLSKSCPQNFLNKLALLEAELTSINNNADGESVVKSYDKAILLSKENGFIHEKALACERAGISFILSGYTDPRNYLTQAFDTYKQWGAKAKLIQMKKLYPTHLSNMSCPDQINADDNNLETISTVSELTNPS